MELPNFESRNHKIKNHIHNGNNSFVTKVVGHGSSNTA